MKKRLHSVETTVDFCRADFCNGCHLLKILSLKKMLEENDFFETGKNCDANNNWTEKIPWWWICEKKDEK